jgi:hypothetical protein
MLRSKRKAHPNAAIHKCILIAKPFPAPLTPDMNQVHMDRIAAACKSTSTVLDTGFLERRCVDRRINVHAAMKLLADFHQICQTLQIPYYLEGGTLLGVVRDKKLLEWDNDVDVTIHTQSMTAQRWHALVDALKQDGFVPFRINTFEFSVHKYDEYLDIHYSHKSNSYNSGITTVTVGEGGSQLNIPGLVDEYLTKKYGNWRVVNRDANAHSWLIPGS